MRCLDLYRYAGRASPQRGYVMVLSMLILLLITILSISMARSFFLEEGMAGNLREKSRSFSAAQAALSYGEWYISKNPTGGINCSTAATTGFQANPEICTNAVGYTSLTGSLNFASTTHASPLTTYFLAPTSSYLNVSASGGQDTFFAPPGLYIQFVGLDTTNSDNIYEVTAYGFGGSQNSVTIVQSYFVTLAAVRNLGGL